MFALNRIKTRNLLYLFITTSYFISPLGADSEEWTLHSLQPVTIQADLAPNFQEPSLYSLGLTPDGGALLQNSTGISFSRFGGRGIEPVIRGKSQTALQVSLDGASVHGGCPNRMDPPTSWAALGTYESVIIEKGVQSLANGAPSGGSVRFKRDLRQLVQSNDQFRLITGSGDNGFRYDISGDGVWSSANQFFFRHFFQLKDHGHYQDGDNQWVSSAFSHRQIGSSLGWTPSPKKWVELNIESHAFQDAHYPGAKMDSPDESAQIFRFLIEDQLNLTWLDQHRFNFFYSDVDHVMDNTTLRNTAMTRQVDSETLVKGANWHGWTDLTRLSLHFGLEWERRDREATLTNPSSPSGNALSRMWPNVLWERTGVFIESNQTLGSQHTLKTSLRWDHHRMKANSSKGTTDSVSPLTAYSLYHANPRSVIHEKGLSALLRLQSQLHEKLSSHLSLSRTLRFPDATERFMSKWHPSSTQRWIGNPGLNEEVHHLLEGGLSSHLNHLGWSFTLYIEDIDHHVLREPARGQNGILLSDGADTYRNINAQLEGWEGEIWFSMNESLQIRANIAGIRGHNLSDHRPLPRIPAIEGDVELQSRYSQGSWGLKCRWASSQKRVDSLSRLDVGPSPGYGVFDLWLRIKLKNKNSIRLGCDNILDHTYAEHLSRDNIFDPTPSRVNEPGRSFWARTEWLF